MELTTQSPRCRSDDRTHVNTRLSHRKHAFDSPRRRRSRGDETRPFRGKLDQLYQGNRGHVAATRATLTTVFVLCYRIRDRRCLTSFSFCFLIPDNSYREHTVRYTYMTQHGPPASRSKLYMKKTSYCDCIQYSKHQLLLLHASVSHDDRRKICKLFFRP